MPSRQKLPDRIKPKRSRLRRFGGRILDAFDWLDAFSALFELGWIGFTIGIVILLVTGIVWLAIVPASSLFLGRGRRPNVARR